MSSHLLSTYCMQGTAPRTPCAQALRVPCTPPGGVGAVIPIYKRRTLKSRGGDFAASFRASRPVGAFLRAICLGRLSAV